MNSTFTITDDGTISRIREDGVIVKLGHIDKNGTITGTKFEGPKEPPAPAKGKKIYIFFLCLFATLSIFLFFLYRDAVNSREYWFNNYLEVDKESINIRHTLLSISNKYPLLITNVEFANIYENGNIETDYGKKMYASRSMYIKPKISYIGLEEKKVDLKYKIINPSGNLRTGRTSPTGYSTSTEIFINSGSNTAVITGWGNSDKGNSSAGVYTFELYYNGNILYKKNFIYY